MKTYVFINLRSMLKLSNSFYQIISGTDKQRYFLIFMDLEYYEFNQIKYKEVHQIF